MERYRDFCTYVLEEVVGALLLFSTYGKEQGVG